MPDFFEQGGQVFRLVVDPRGSVRLVVRLSDGQVMQRINYLDEWGQGQGGLLGQSQTALQPFGFAGGLTDATTRLVHFGARDYDPATRRWLQKDPLGFDGGDGNLYAYVSNDPISFIDPLGLMAGAPYKTIYDAAVAALAEYNLRSIAMNEEIGGLIYKKGNYYYHTYGYKGYNIGNKRLSFPGVAIREVLDAGGTEVGDFHTHGGKFKEGEIGERDKLIRSKGIDSNILGCWKGGFSIGDTNRADSKANYLNGDTYYSFMSTAYGWTGIYATIRGKVYERYTPAYYTQTMGLDPRFMRTDAIKDLPPGWRP